MPPPDLLRSYNNVLPGGAEYIVTMVEEEARHRHEIERQCLFIRFALLSPGSQKILGA